MDTMKKSLAVRCPSCNANTRCDQGMEFCFCSYCGAQIALEDKSTRHTYRQIDDARIREAEVGELVRLKELELEAARMKQGNRITLIWIALMVLLLLVSIWFFATPDSRGISQGAVGIVLLMFDVILFLGGVIALAVRKRSRS